MTPNERKLNAALRMLTGDHAREAPADVERVLLAAFRSRQRKRKTAMWWSVGSVAATVAAGVAFMMLVRPAVPPVARSPHNSGQAQARPTPAHQQTLAVEPKVYRVPKPRRPRQ